MGRWFADDEHHLIRRRKGRAVFGAGASAVAGPGGRRFDVAEPFLHFAQIGAAVQRVRGRRGPQGVRAETFSTNAGDLGVLS